MSDREQDMYRALREAMDAMRVHVRKPGAGVTPTNATPTTEVTAVPTLNAAQLSAQQETRERALAALDALGAATVQDDSVEFKGDRFVVPAQFSEDLKQAAQFLVDLDRQENKKFQFGRTFKFRMWDGAAAFDRACKRVFGTAGLGQTIPATMFSKEQPPELRSIAVGPHETLQVSWGTVLMPPLSAEFTLTGTRDPEYGELFHLHVEAPRKMRRRLEAFFDVVQDELVQRSIYRGKAFNSARMPEFMDLSWVNPDAVVYTDEVMAQLEANVWTLLRHTAEVRAAGLPLKRSVLFEGPYGTGKSMACGLTAKTAVENGWTFVQVRPGKDDLLEALSTAKLYAPAVVQVEDIDILAGGDSEEEIARLLDAMDGIGSKGTGVVLIATTNHVGKIQKGVMRPGRLDAVIHIGRLDRRGVERLIRSVIRPESLGDIDYDVVFKSLDGFLPAFVTETCGQAVRYSMARNAGKVGTINTDDICLAGQGLMRQKALMEGATAGVAALPSLDAQFRALMADGARGVVDGAALIDEDGDTVLCGTRLVVDA